jgi:Curli production assembly/transport component CsgG
MIRSSFAIILAILALPLRAGVLDDSGGGGSKPAQEAPSALASSPTSSSQSSPTPSTSLSSPAAPPSNSPGPDASTLPKSLKPVPVASSSNDPYDKLAMALAQSSGSEGKINVSIGNFLDGDTDHLSPRSTEVKEELAIALPKTGKFEIIARERLADLQNEGKFQSSDIVQTSGVSNQVGLKAVNGIIRGRIVSKPEGTVVYSEIAYINGGEVREVKALIPGPPVAKETAPHGVSKVPDPKSAQSMPSVAPEKRAKTLPHQESKGYVVASPVRPAALVQPMIQGKPKSVQSDHPLINEINQRAERLEKRLKHCLDQGLIKPGQANEIRSQIGKIKRQESRFILQNDGFLTKKESDLLNQEEDQLSQQILNDKRADRHHDKKSKRNN